MAVAFHEILEEFGIENKVIVKRAQEESNLPSKHYRFLA